MYIYYNYRKEIKMKTEMLIVNENRRVWQEGSDEKGISKLKLLENYVYLLTNINNYIIN